MDTSQEIFELSGKRMENSQVLNIMGKEHDLKIKMGTQILSNTEFDYNIEMNREIERDDDLPPGSLDLAGAEIVIKEQVIIINYDSPFKISRKRIHKTQNPLGWTRVELYKAIQSAYSVFFKEEIMGFYLDQVELDGVLKVGNEYYLEIEC